MPGHQGPVPRSVYETLEVKLCDIFSPAVPWRVPCHMRLGSHRRPLLRFKGFSFGTCRRPSGPSFLGAATVTLLASYGGSGLFDAWGVLAFGSLGKGGVRLLSTSMSSDGSRAMALRSSSDGCLMPAFMAAPCSSALSPGCQSRCCVVCRSMNRATSPALAFAS